MGLQSQKAALLLDKMQKYTQIAYGDPPYAIVCVKERVLDRAKITLRQLLRPQIVPECKLQGVCQVGSRYTQTASGAPRAASECQGEGVRQRRKSTCIALELQEVLESQP